MIVPVASVRQTPRNYGIELTMQWVTWLTLGTRTNTSQRSVFGTTRASIVVCITSVQSVILLINSKTIPILYNVTCKTDKRLIVYKQREPSNHQPRSINLYDGQTCKGNLTLKNGYCTQR